MALELSDVLNSIYDCEDNCSISSDWDGGWRVTIGGSRHTVWDADAYVENVQAATEWLHAQALARCPAYKERYGDRVTLRSNLA